MTYDPTTTLAQLQTLLTNTGSFGAGVQIGEPFAPPVLTTTTLLAAILFQTYEPAGTTLNTTIEVWDLLVRIYALAGMTPADASTVEQNLAKAFASTLATLAGHYTLGSTVRAIDWAGEEAGRKVGAKWGHLVISGTIFRVVDLVVPLIVDDSATFAA